MKTMERRSRGVALPFTILAMIVISGFVVTMSSLNQGLKNQIFHTNNHQLSFLLAYSAFSKVLAKIHSESWTNRAFKSGPYAENNVSLQGGTYDLFVENSPGKDYQADIYVRTHLAGITRMYFWRIRFNDDLLDISSRITVEFFTNGEPGDFPKSGSSGSFSSKVDSMLARRAANQNKSDLMARDLADTKGAKAILQKMDGRPLKPFTDSYPADPEDKLMNTKDLAAFPKMKPIGKGELPTADGPGTTPPTGADYPPLTPVPSALDTSPLEKLAKDIASHSQGVASMVDKGWTEIDTKGVDGIASAQQAYVEANKLKAEAYSDMNSLISYANVILGEAPSAEAKAAIEEMVSQAVTAGIDSIVTAIDRGFDHLKDGDTSYLDSLQTSEAVANLLTDWQNAATRTEEEVTKLNGYADKISNYSKLPEVQEKLSKALTNAQKQLELIKSMVELAKKRLEELKKKEEEEAAAAAAAAAAANEPAGPDPSIESKGELPIANPVPE